jgi:hypothetical protein
MSKTNSKAESLSAGHKFSFWTVRRLATKPDYLECECVCGLVRNVNAYSLTSGKSKSCGCKSKSISKQTRENRNG